MINFKKSESDGLVIAKTYLIVGSNIYAKNPSMETLCEDDKKILLQCLPSLLRVISEMHEGEIIPFLKGLLNEFRTVALDHLITTNILNLKDEKK